MTGIFNVNIWGLHIEDWGLKFFSFFINDLGESEFRIAIIVATILKFSEINI